MVALGAQTFNPSPVSVGATADNSFGTGIAAAGQDIGRAINSTRSSQARMDAFTKTSQELTLQKMGLENELLASQVRKSNQVGISPPMPVAGKQPQLVDGQSATNLSTVGGFPVKDDDITSKAETYPQHRQIRILGVPVKTNPHSADAQDIEDRYGDLVEEVAGVGNIGADALYTIYKWLQSKQRAARGRSDLGKLRNSADEYFERR